MRIPSLPYLKMRLPYNQAMNIRRPREIIEKIIDVVAHWSDYATPLGIPQETIGAIKSTIITRL